MTSENTPDNLNLGRGWLNRAAEMLAALLERRQPDAEFARAAAAIGNGFVALAQAQMSAPVSLRLTSEMPPALISAVERAGRAAAEARPHDELTAHGVGSLSEAIGLAIQDAYAGIEFEDPAFERGTDAVMAVLRERREADRG